MKVLVFYRPNSEYARIVEVFVHDLQTRHGVDERHLEVIDYDSRDGAAMASMYDVVNQPTIMIVGNDGGYIKDWQGSSLPLLDEVAGYVYSQAS